MNKHIELLDNKIESLTSISEEDKQGLLSLTKKLRSTIEVLEFKLSRTEKIKRTMEILLQETIEELEQALKELL